MYTEAALLHDSATSNCYVRVEVISERFGPDWFPEVEESDNVRTTICTVSGTYAAVVYLNIHTFSVVIGRVHRADGLTWSIFTVLTHDGNEPGFDVREFAFPIPLDSDPLVGPPLQEQILGINRQVILRLTSDNTGLTTGAPVEVYYHAPFMIDPR